MTGLTSAGVTDFTGSLRGPTSDSPSALKLHVS